MGIAGIAVLLVQFCNRCLGFGIVTEAAVELFCQLCLYRISYLIGTLFCQSSEPFPNLGIIFTGQQVQQTLQIAGNQNVHRRRCGGIELTVPVVYAGADKVCQNLIDIGRTDQLAEGHAHHLGIVSRQNVTEITGRHYNVQQVTVCDLSGFCQRNIRGNIVHDLRYQSAPVNGVRTGECHTALFQCFQHLVVGEDLLDTTLAVVEVALYGTNCNVLAFLCHHLPLLHVADTFYRIEDHDLGARNVLEALQCSLTGITGSCYQNDYLLVHVQLLHSSCQEVRQDLQSHILECTSRTMPQFQHVGSLEQVCDLCNVLGVKCLGCVSTLCAVTQFGIGVICQILGKHKCCPLCIIHASQRFQFVHRDRRNGFRYKQTAFFRNSLCDCSGTLYPNAAVSGALVKHCYHPFPGRIPA